MEKLWENTDQKDSSQCYSSEQKLMNVLNNLELDSNILLK